MQTGRTAPKMWIPWVGAGLSYSKNPIAFFQRMVETYGDFCQFKMAGQTFVLLSSPESIEQVLLKNAKNYHKGPVLNSMPEVFGSGLLTAEGEIWKRHRLLAQPAFHRKRIETYASEMQSSVDRVLLDWKAQPIRSLHADMMAITLDIVVDALFGTSIQTQKHEIGAAFKTILDYFEFMISLPGQIFKSMPTPRRAAYRKAVQFLDRVIADLVEKTKNTSVESPLEGENLLGMLVAAQLDEDGKMNTKFSAKDLRDEVMTLFIAGHETSASALTFCLHQIVSHPEVYQTLMSEIENPSPAPNGERSGSHPPPHSYLEKVIREAMRIYPPVWTIGRQAYASDTLVGHTIAADTLVLIPTHAIHRNKHFYPQPETFHPDRWTPEFEKALPRAAYLPFGLGARMCIGQGFAMMELEIILVSILSRFKLEILDSKPIRLVGTLTARPKDEIRILAIPLNGKKT